MIARLRALSFLAALAAALAVAPACGPSARSGDTTPRLPGETDPPAADPAVDPEEPDPWAGRDDLIRAPAPVPPAPVELPPIERFTLPNGLQVLVVSSRELPIASFRLAVGAGQIDEPREKRALADFAAQMLTKGVRGRDADRIAETIDSVGGSLGASAGYEHTFVTCEVLSKDLATCLDLLPAVVISPTFPEKEMPEVRDAITANLRQMRDSAGMLAAEHFRNALWGEDHVRGWPVTSETVGAIGRKDLVAWHGARFKPNNAVLVVAGDVDAKALRAQLARAFAGWRRGPVPPRKEPVEPAGAGLRVRLVDKPNQTQSHILIGHLGVAQTDPDYLATITMNYTLGGGAFSSRLMQVVRSDAGKTYGASSSFERARRRGAFTARTFTRNVETVPTLKLVLREIERMRGEGPSAAELADAIANLAGGYPLDFESASDVASAVLSAELAGLGEDWVRQFAVRVGALDLEQVRAAARSRLDPANAVVVIVGKADDVAPQLKAAGIPFETVGYLEPISRRDREALQRVDPKLVEEGRKLMDAALAAKGGETRVRGLKDIVMRGKISVKAGGQAFAGQFVRTFRVPDAIRNELQIPQGTITIVIAPGGAWQSFGPQLVDMPADLAAEARSELWRDRDLVLLRHKEPGVVVQATGREKVGDRDADVVVLQKEDGSLRTKLFLDPKTRLLLRMEYESGGSLAREDFGDYRAVNGIQFAHTLKREGGGQALEGTIDKIELNVGVKAELFEKPR